MSRMIRPPNSRATGVGALPHTDPVLACDDVLDIFPNSLMPPRSRIEGSLKALSLTILHSSRAGSSARTGCCI